MTARLSRLVQKVHRLFGSVFALLLAVWFLSGAVMTFAEFPFYAEAERLASAPPLPRGAELALAPELLTRLQTDGLAQGLRPRLGMLEGLPAWLAPDRQGVRRAYRNAPPWSVSELDEARVRAELARQTSKSVNSIERVDEPDQWSVGLAGPGALPFYRAWLADTEGADNERGKQLYLSARTGEIVQDSVRSERALAWLGAIPHWIYPTILRRHRALWSDSVLVLSALGLVVSLSGTFAGLVLWWIRRRKKIERAVRDPVLRWHQRIGLGFGALVSTWLFSGALSLSPFDWTGDKGPSAGELRALHGGVLAANAPLSAALAACQRELAVRELELASFGKHVYAVCYDQTAQTRLVNLSDPSLTPRRALDAGVFARLAAELSGRVREQTAYDSYYYPTHRGPPTALPYERLELPDSEQTTVYLDPTRARVARRFTQRGRLERWLYHGVHSLDLPGLYERTVLWRTLVITLMLVGATLSLLGCWMTVRKILRRRQRVRRV